MREIVFYDENVKPEYQTPGSMCMDLKAAEEMLIRPGQIIIMPTGIKTNFPSKIYVRSSLSLNQGLTLANDVGIIDEDYREEIGVILYNFGFETQIIKQYERIAQIETLTSGRLIESFRFDTTQRTNAMNLLTKEEWDNYGTKEILERQGGFGSTGTL